MSDEKKYDPIVPYYDFQMNYLLEYALKKKKITIKTYRVDQNVLKIMLSDTMFNHRQHINMTELRLLINDLYYGDALTIA
jgi:hypothetical protein